MNYWNIYCECLVMVVVNTLRVNSHALYYLFKVEVKTTSICHFIPSELAFIITCAYTFTRSIILLHNPYFSIRVRSGYRLSSISWLINVSLIWPTLADSCAHKTNLCNVGETKGSLFGVAAVKQRPLNHNSFSHPWNHHLKSLLASVFLQALSWCFGW